MKQKIIIIYSAIFILGCLLNAQQITWEIQDLFPSVSDVKIAPNGDVYVMSSQGLNVSRDDGNTWTTLNDRNSYPCLLITSNGYIYSYGGYSAGIARSTDNGETWSNVNQSYLFSAMVEGVNKIYAGVKDGKLLVSSDDGSTFALRTTTSAEIRAMYFAQGGFGARSVRGSILIGDGGGNVYHTEDEGVSLTMFTDRERGEILKGVGIKTFCRIGQDELFVGGAKSFSGENGACFRTTNGGVNWTMPGDGLSTENITSLFYHNETLYATEGASSSSGVGGLFSFDYNTSVWNRVANFPSINSNVVAVNSVSGKFYVGTSYGLYVSADGVEWQKCNYTSRKTQSLRYIYNYYLSSQNGLFLMSAGKLLKKDTYDSEWGIVPSPSTNATIICMLILDDGTMIAAGSNKIYKSIDMGTNWQILYTTNFYTGILTKNSKNYIYATTDKFHNDFGQQSTKIIRSKDSGATWEEIYNEPAQPEGTDIFIGDDDTIYIILAYSKGIAKSTDDGDTWVTIKEGINDGGNPIDFRKILSNSRGHIFVSCNEGIFRTTDKGITWDRQIEFPKRPFCINSHDVIYSIHEGDNYWNVEPSLWCSENYENGDLQVTNSGLSQDFLKQMTEMGDCSVEYMFFWDDYLYISNGVSLIKSSEQLIGNTNITEDLDIQEEFSLLNNYPNPFNPTTNIEFTLPESGFTKLAVYNSLGEEVAVVVNNYLSAGKYSYNFDGKNLTSGVYLYSLISGESIKTRKMLLLK